jgi:hypothetical protein
MDLGDKKDVGEFQEAWLDRTTKTYRNPAITLKIETMKTYPKKYLTPKVLSHLLAGPI